MLQNNVKPVALIGYSGHAYVVIDILQSADVPIAGYCEPAEKPFNPFALPFLGNDTEDSTPGRLEGFDYFVAIGDNLLRRKVSGRLAAKVGVPVNAIHRNAVVSPSCTIGTGIMIAAGVIINPLVRIGNGAICNTSCSIDHECIIGDFAHIAPGAVLSGNVTVGNNTFIGANATIIQGITIGNNVIIGAGAVVLRDVPDNKVIAGNPGRELIKNKTDL